MTARAIKSDFHSSILAGLRVGYQGLQSRPNPHVRSSGDDISLNPLLSFVLMADVIVVRVRDWTAIGGLTVHYESEGRKFSAWAADGASPLRRAMDIALEETFRQIKSPISSEQSSRPQI